MSAQPSNALLRAMLPPVVESAERGMLGALVVNPSYLKEMPDLEVEHFGHLKHRIAFAAIRDLEAVGKTWDVGSLALQIEKQGKLDAIGGIAYLSELQLADGAYVTLPTILDRERVIRDFALKRRVMVACGDVVERGCGTDISGDELLTEASTSIGAMDGVKPDTVLPIGEVAKRRVKQLEQIIADRESGKPSLTGAPTGIRALDVKLGGWQFGIVNLLAARPGMGKSAAALATADACSENGVGVHVFSLEDSASAYVDRAMARRSGIATVNLRRAELVPDDTARLANAMMRLIQRKGWLLDDRGGLTASEITRAARRQREKNKTRVVVVDYINLVRKRDPRMSEYDHLGEAIGTFADAAKCDDIAYLVLCQLNRKLEDRNDKRPVLSDLRGSGELEEKCKVAVALYRGSYYGGKPKRDVDYECNCPEGNRSCTAHAPTQEAWEHQVQCLILKGGNGPTGVVMANWNGPTTEVW